MGRKAAKILARLYVLRRPLETVAFFACHMKYILLHRPLRDAIQHPLQHEEETMKRDETPRLDTLPHTLHP